MSNYQITFTLSNFLGTIHIVLWYSLLNTPTFFVISYLVNKSNEWLFNFQVKLINIMKELNRNLFVILLKLSHSNSFSISFLKEKQWWKIFLFSRKMYISIVNCLKNGHLSSHVNRIYLPWKERSLNYFPIVRKRFM